MKPPANLLNLQFRLQTLESNLRLAQLRAMLLSIDKELYTLQDVLAEMKTIIADMEAAR